ncbi:hypothetical protein [Ruegeria faecimaris]|uniref:hypothetical protein n=1 Tax=Ruegeria faecimaris TaxID=686389 RepID=UPI002492F8AF|nr:hypothetical protein [Ruegeria faecimaris]
MEPDQIILIFAVGIGVFGLAACWLTWRSLPEEPKAATDEEIEEVFLDKTKTRAIFVDDIEYQKRIRKEFSEKDDE